MVASHSNTVKQKPRNVLFIDDMLKSLRMREFEKNLNGSIAHFKPLPEQRQSK